MKRFLRQLWARMNEPENEKILIVLLPCIAILAAGLILAPRLIFFAKEAMEIAEELPPLPAANAEKSLDFPEVSPTEYIISEPVPTSPPTPNPNEIFVDTPTFAPVEVEEDNGNWLEIDGKTYYLDDNGTHAVGLTQIDGKLYYFDQNGVKARALGIDVSQYNKGINWPAVKAQGIDFAIIRVGGRGWESGIIYDDDFYYNNIIGAKKADIDLGLYFYSTAITKEEAIREASYAVSLLRGLELEYPIFIDIEQSGDYPYGRSDSMNKSMRQETVKAFCDTVRQYGYESGIYSGVYFFDYNVAFAPLTEHYIWIANYTRYNRLPNFSGHYDMWQFTDSGTVNGINTKVDMNVIF